MTNEFLGNISSTSKTMSQGKRWLRHATSAIFGAQASNLYCSVSENRCTDSSHLCWEVESHADFKCHIEGPRVLSKTDLIMCVVVAVALGQEGAVHSF